MVTEYLEITRYIRAALIAICLLAAAAIAQEPDSPNWLDGYPVRYKVQLTGNVDKTSQKAAIARIPSGNWARDDAGDVTVQTADGKQLPAAILAHAQNGHTIVQFERVEKQSLYWISLGHPTAKAPRREPIPEGLTLEVRQWEGDSIASWPDVRAGLEKSKNVLGAYLPGDIQQNLNPAKPLEPTNFACSYRGWLNVPKDGTYRIFANSDDAVFLFIDDFLVTERPGTNRPRRGRLPIKDVGTDIELKAGVHPIEVHHAVGNNQLAYGLCTLVWIKPGDKSWEFITHDRFVKANLARVVTVEAAPKTTAAFFSHGIDDVLTTISGLKIFLVDFQALGNDLPEDESQIKWDFGDGTTATGKQVTHLFYEEGDYTVSVTTPTQKQPHTQRVHVWAAPGRSSPFSPARVIDVFAETDWKNGDINRIFQMFDFLLICRQPNRWPLVEQVTKFLLDLNEPDPQFRAQLWSQRIEALAQLGRTDDALAAAKTAKEELAKISVFKMEVQLAEARVHARFLRQLSSASKLYEAIIEEHRRLNDPLLRKAATLWGDVCMQAGDQAQAADCYRLADTFGGDDFRATASTEAITRGALLRLAEQKLRDGDIKQTKTLLQRIETQYPEQKAEGLYRFLSAETDRVTGEYEDAMEDYAVLLKLPQWAGLHDKAIFGVSDTYFRMRDYKSSLKWLENLRKNFPEYGEQKKLDEREDLLKQLIERRGDEDNFLRKQVQTFELNNDAPTPIIHRFNVGKAQGINGPYTIIADNHPQHKSYLDIEIPLENFEPSAMYWVEIWYREEMLQSMVGHRLHIHNWFRDEQNRGNADFNNDTTRYVQRTFGNWRRLGFLHRAPWTLDGNLYISMRYNWGVIEVDNISIRYVSDRQHEALANFIEGIGEEAEVGDE